MVDPWAKIGWGLSLHASFPVYPAPFHAFRSSLKLELFIICPLVHLDGEAHYLPFGPVLDPSLARSTRLVRSKGLMFVYQPFLCPIVLSWVSFHHHDSFWVDPRQCFVLGPFYYFNFKLKLFLILRNKDLFNINQH